MGCGAFHTNAPATMRLTPMHSVRSFVFALAAGVAACAHPAPEAATPGANYDVVITNAKIIDGTGDPFYYGDIGIRGDRIAAVTPRGALAEAAAKERVDANGLAVSPGFIDIQSHSWNALLFADSRVVGKVAQGVTSEILGEGSTPAPSNTSLDSIYAGGSGGDSVMARYVTKFRGPHGFGIWLGTMEAHGMSVNAGSFLG